MSQPRRKKVSKPKKSKDLLADPPKSTKKKDSDPKALEMPSRSPFRELAEIAFYGLTILIFMKGYSWQNFQIPTKSMENSLLIGDHITANTFIFKNASDWEKAIFPFRDVIRGDVVVFKYPGEDRQDWIKRCIGLPGDKFEIRDNQLFINDKIVEQKFPYYKQTGMMGDRDPDNKNYPLNYETDKPGLKNAHPGYRRIPKLDAEDLKRMTRATMTQGSFTNYRRRDAKLFKQIMKRLDDAPKGVIPEGFYVMMGDNRSYSEDSRKWGMVPKEFIEGRAYWIWWSYGEDENSHTKKGTNLVMSYLRVAWRFFTHTHFSRTFDLIK